MMMSQLLVLKKEIELAQSCFADFIEYVQSISIAELDARLIDRSDVGYQRYLGDMLLRIAYHDAVHTGQFLQYLRMVEFRKTIDLGLNLVIIYKFSKLAFR